jgi:hypothetical protein
MFVLFKILPTRPGDDGVGDLGIRHKGQRRHDHEKITNPVFKLVVSELRKL